MDFYYCTRCKSFINQHEACKDFGSGAYKCYRCIGDVKIYKNRTFTEMVQIERVLKIKNLLK